MTGTGSRTQRNKEARHKKDKSGVKRRATIADIICRVIGCFLHRIKAFKEQIEDKIEIIK